MSKQSQHEVVWYISMDCYILSMLEEDIIFHNGNSSKSIP